jgi:hypothetical protein
MDAASAPAPIAVVLPTATLLISDDDGLAVGGDVLGDGAGADDVPVFGVLGDGVPPDPCGLPVPGMVGLGVGVCDGGLEEPSTAGT